MRILLVFLLSVAPTWAADYFVRTDGTNTNSGLTNSAAGAWLTVQKAANTMVAGDSVTVVAGDYDEQANETTSGTEGNVITYTTSGAVTIGGFELDGDYITIDGDFTIDGRNATGFLGALEIDGDNIIIKNCTFVSGIIQVWLIHWDTSDPTPQSTWLEGNTFGANYYHTLGMSGSGHTITNNSFLNSTNGGDIFLVSSDNTLFVDNVVSNCGNVNRTGGCLKVGAKYWFVDVSGSPDFENIGAGAPPYSTGENVDNFTVTGTAGGCTNPTSWGTAEVRNTSHADIFQAHSTSCLGGSTNVTIDGNLFIDCPVMQIGNMEDQCNDGSVSDWTWSNNVWDNVEAIMSVFTPNFKFYNNVFYQSGQNSGAPILFRADSSSRNVGVGARIFNNLFVEACSDPTNTGQGWPQGVSTNISRTNTTCLKVGAEYRWQTVHASSDFSNIGAGAAPYTNNNTFTVTGDANSCTNPTTWSDGSLVQLAYHSDVDYESDYNLVIGTGGGTTKVGFDDVNGINGQDPLFVNPATDNFHLQSGSPCIAAATNLNALFTLDYDNVTRGDTWDIGAFEFAAETPWWLTHDPSVSGVRIQ